MSLSEFCRVFVFAVVCASLFCVSQLLIVPACAQETLTTFKLEVHAGDFDRVNEIVRAEIPLEKYRVGNYVLTDDESGKTMLAQLDGPNSKQIEKIDVEAIRNKTESPKLEGWLTFVLPELAAGKTMKVTAEFSKDAGEYRWNDNETTEMELKFGELPMLKYMYEAVDDSSPERRDETYKIYHQVYTPNGDQLMTKGAGGLFPHHRGVFFGYNRISYEENKKADVWHCKNGESQLSFYADSLGGVVRGYSIGAVKWNGQDGKPFAIESRQVSAMKAGDATVIDFSSTVNSTVSKLVFKGDPQHAGVQFRASQTVPDKTKHLTYYVRPDGKAKPGAFRNWSAKKDETEINKSHIDLKWLALCMALPKSDVVAKGDDKLTEDGVTRYTVCYLPAASNPKPARFSERDYGRFGSYFEYDFDKVGVGIPLKVDYRYWIQEGEMSVEQIEAVANAYLNPAKAKLVD